jgi:VWFA-related protein
MNAPKHSTSARDKAALFRLLETSLCLLPALLPVSSAVHAQDSQPTATFELQTKLVNVYASVRDKSGNTVKDLDRDSFAVEEDGRPQKITFFSRENDMPLLLGLMVDTSPSEARMIEQERDASRLFLLSVMDPKRDQAFLIHFDSEVELMQDLTPSVEKMGKALDKLVKEEGGPSQAGKAEALAAGSGQAQNPPNVSIGPAQGPPGNPGSASGQESVTTQLYDAVYLASTEVLNDQEGRKALIVIGDGDDVGSVVSEARAIRAAQEADVLIYCIRILDKDFASGGASGKKGLSIPQINLPGMGGGRGGPPGGGPGGPAGGGPSGPGAPEGAPGGGSGADQANGKKNMQDLASETGGALFEVTKKTSLLDVFAQIQDELRSLYSLGYTPEAKALPGYRRLKVTVNRKGLKEPKVQARAGYYASKNDK